MPLACSISIQSDTVARRPALPWIAPASVIARACRTSASVRVDLPASGWLITAKVLRRRASAETRLAAAPFGARMPGVLQFVVRHLGPDAICNGRYQ